MFFVAQVYNVLKRRQSNFRATPGGKWVNLVSCVQKFSGRIKTLSSASRLHLQATDQTWFGTQHLLNIMQSAGLLGPAIPWCLSNDCNFHQSSLKLSFLNFAFWAKGFLRDRLQGSQPMHNSRFANSGHFLYRQRIRFASSKQLV